ncbi:hypothetical protein GGTG_01615 [Gaeumannomyces tritici R3-111a-1]|uniref:Protein YAE1 n=1 Tax=Gaeumannomyces tritici (strain R3-111a-1) TaxID=644352 RepID=J3NK33_GAET3|nr:hypothetical protein GGTG_01615 [Gaeumannomyces tritici R3-111a-1]EJT81637.1 hypothetical protein GGTG_01615 [Gaeumannomyces tritici R3-111a-1]
MHIRPEALPHGEDGLMFVSELGEPQPPPPHAASPGPLDDVFGGDDDERDEPLADRQPQSHPSDMRRLQAEHSTAGYRDGVTAAKAASVQAGFDEGFGLGAALGLRAGELLGVLEGLAAATSSPGAGGYSGHAARLGGLLDAARDELSPRAIFGSTYWAPDGTWVYPVAAVAAAEDGGGGDHEDVLFEDVVEAHPLVAKWRAVVQEEMERWGIDKGALFRYEANTGDGGGDGDDSAAAGDRTAKAHAQIPKTPSTTALPKMAGALQW